MRLAIDHGPAGPFHSQSVFAGDHPVGMIALGGYGHRTGLSLGIALPRPGTGDEGLSVQILNETRAARVRPAPPFDPGNTRMLA
ncbi:MAG: glycine cleavage T C-terminal barrel domain-containing protein [Pseudomonadota bacterium]